MITTSRTAEAQSLVGQTVTVAVSSRDTRKGVIMVDSYRRMAWLEGEDGVNYRLGFPTTEVTIWETSC